MIILAALHCFVAVHNQPRKPGSPVVGELSRHFPVQGFRLFCELPIVMFLVADRSQEISDTPSSITAVLPQVFPHSRL